MKVIYSVSAVKQYKSLTNDLQKRLDKQVDFLLKDFRHPSLNTKKYSGVKDIFRGRITKEWRFWFAKQDSVYMVLRIGKHPK